MTNRFMIAVAAVALIAGTGFANAQGTGTSREGAGSTVQQSAAVVRAFFGRVFRRPDEP
jgi:predicted outer membrane protein